MLKLGEALALAEVVKLQLSDKWASSVEENGQARMFLWEENGEEQGYNPQGQIVEADGG